MKKLLLIISLTFCASLFAQDFEKLDVNSLFSDYKIVKAPEAKKLLLKKGDKLAICGDSITEQKMYSRIMETYLTVCVPELSITVRQYGWGGEQAPGFYGRMQNDCLRFEPTIATTCYGMNDHHYVPYKDEFGKDYYDSSTAIVKLFKDNGVRVIHGSPGCVGKKPDWQSDESISTSDLNRSLLEFRNIGVKIAKEQDIAFADLYLPMFFSMFKAQEMYGCDFHVVGNDGVHPDWAGHVIMAYGFLKSMGLDGEIGSISVDLKSGDVDVTDGHKVLSSSVASSTANSGESVSSDSSAEIVIESTRYPFCAKGVSNKQGSIRAGMNLVPFNEELNRLTLRVKHTNAKKYKVVWGGESRIYSSSELNEGVNLAADFMVNPFSDAFNAVDNAVKAKQEYETKQIKSLFHGDEGKNDMELTVKVTEEVRKTLADNIVSEFKPVRHTIRIIAEK